MNTSEARIYFIDTVEDYEAEYTNVQNCIIKIEVSGVNLEGKY